MIPYPEKDIRVRLYTRSEPLTGIGENEHEWLLGGLHLNKQHAEWRSGYSYGLRPESRFFKQFFDIDGTRGFAAIFCAVDPPPSPTYNAMWFAGWVPPEREVELDGWLAFLNEEIAKRLGLPHAASEGNKHGDPDSGAL